MTTKTPHMALIGSIEQEFQARLNQLVTAATTDYPVPVKPPETVRKAVVRLRRAWKIEKEAKAVLADHGLELHVDTGLQWRYDVRRRREEAAGKVKSLTRTGLVRRLNEAKVALVADPTRAGEVLERLREVLDADLTALAQALSRID